MWFFAEEETLKEYGKKKLEDKILLTIFSRSISISSAPLFQITESVSYTHLNKAYSLLRQEGFVTIDRRRGAIIAVDVDKIKALEEMKENLLVALAKGCCRNVSRSEVHDLIDEIYDEYEIDN